MSESEYPEDTNEIVDRVRPWRGDGDFEPLRAWSAEGARVGLTVCRICGCALLVDPTTPFAAGELHIEWHERNGGVT